MDGGFLVLYHLLFYRLEYSLTTNNIKVCVFMKFWVFTSAQRHTGFFFFSCFGNSGNFSLMLYLSRDVCWLALCQVDTTRMFLEEGISVEKNAPTRLPCRQACDAFS